MMTLTTEQVRKILEGTPKGKFYAKRDAYELDMAGNYYTKHVSAMTSEKLHSKSDIAAELACRDLAISTLRQRIDELEAQQSEVAARAVERFADYFAVNYGEGEGFDRAIMHVKIKAKEQANQLRKGEGDE